jgi:hypothetical protein
MPPTDALDAKGVSGVTFTFPQGANGKPCFSLSGTLRWFQSTYDVFVVSRIYVRFVLLWPKFTRS